MSHVILCCCAGECECECSVDINTTCIDLIDGGECTPCTVSLTPEVSEDGCTVTVTFPDTIVCDGDTFFFNNSSAVAMCVGVERDSYVGYLQEVVLSVECEPCDNDCQMTFAAVYKRSECGQIYCTDCPGILGMDC